MSPVSTRLAGPWPNALTPSVVVSTSVYICDNDLHRVPQNTARGTLDAHLSSWSWHCFGLLKARFTLGDAGPKAQSHPTLHGKELEELRAQVA